MGINASARSHVMPRKWTGWSQPIISPKFPKNSPKKNPNKIAGKEEMIRIFISSSEPFYRCIDLFHQQGKGKDHQAIADIPYHDPKEKREKNCKDRARVDLAIIRRAYRLHEKFKRLNKPGIVVEGGCMFQILLSSLKFDHYHAVPELLLQVVFCFFIIFFQGSSP